MSILNLDMGIVWAFIDLAILLLLMKKFLFKRVTDMLDQRSKEIADTIDDANAQKEQAEKTREEYEEHLKSARLEAQAIVDEAKKRGQQEYQQMLDKAREDIARLQESARQQAQAERQALLDQARQEITDLALLAASKVSEQNRSTDADRALVDSFLSEVEEIA